MSSESWDKGTSPERRGKWRTGLHEAADENNHERLIQLGVEAGFRDLLDAQDEYGRTALLIACQRGHTNIVVLLLEENANVLIPASGGYTCLHEAAFFGHALVVSLLLGSILEVGSTQLGTRTVFPPDPSVRKELIERQTAEDKFTALHLASIRGYQDVMISIFESYVDISFELNDPHVPRPDLHLDDIDKVSWERFQTRTGLPELIKLRKAASRSSYSASASTLHDHIPTQYRPPKSGVKWAKDADFNKRLVDARLDLAIYVNSQDCLGRTAIHYAAWANKVSVISNLIAAGANVNATDSFDFTPLHFASRNGNSQMVSKLIELSTDLENVYLLDGNVASKSNVSSVKLTELLHRSHSSSSSHRLGTDYDVRPTVTDFSFVEERDGVTPLRYATEGYGNIQWINLADMGYFERDYVGVVRSLLEIIDVKDYGLFSPSFNGESLWTVVFPRLNPHYQFLQRNQLQRLFNFTGAGRVHDLGKELMKKAVELARNKSDMDLFLSIQTQLVWTLEEVLKSRFMDIKLVTSNVGFDEQTGLTLFHFAAFAGLGMETRGLLSVPEVAECVNQCWDQTNQTPLHIAVVEGNEDVVAALVENDKVRVTEEDYRKRTPLQIAVEKSREEKFSDSWKNVEKLLLKRGEVQRFVDKLYKDRQVYVDAANAILVGAALIASVTFVGWLQPPLGYTTYFEILFSTPNEAPAPQSFMAVRQYSTVRAFFVFNSLSFFFAIATVISGAGAVLPAFSFFIKDEVDLVRKWLMLTSVLLIFSITFVIGAFVAAGMAALPPIPKYQAYMIVTGAIGICVWILILITFFYRLYVIHPYKWLTRQKDYLRARLPWRFRRTRMLTPSDLNSTLTAWIDRKYY